MPQQRARLNTDLAKNQLGLNAGSPILAEIAGVKGGTHAGAEQTIEKVAIELIQPNPYQPRRDFNDQGIEELAEVIKMMGFFGALLGRRQQRHIELAYGERRLRAARLAGLQEIPIEIRSLSDQDMFNVSLVENEQRQDLTQLEVGEALERAMSQFELSERDIAARLGKSKGYVRNRVELARLPDDLKVVLRQNTVESFSPSHARELSRILDPSLRRVLMEKVLNDACNFQQTKDEVDLALGLTKKPVALPISEPEEFDDDEEGDVIIKAPPLRHERERAYGIDRLRQQGEQFLESIKRLSADERINRQELRLVLEQVYVKIVEYATELS